MGGKGERVAAAEALEEGGGEEGVDEEVNRQAGIVSSDYRFVYLGVKGTWTPLHAGGEGWGCAGGEG